MAFAFNKFSENLKDSFGTAREATLQSRESGATRQLNKAREELSNAMTYDPTLEPIAGEEDGKPTYRDLQGARDRYKKALRVSGDMDFEVKANKLWASDLSTGFTTYANQAANLLENGNADAAARAMKHAGSFAPNGIKYDVKVKDGNLVIKGEDERTGKPVSEKVLSPKDVRMWAAYGQDPASFIKASNEESRLAMEQAESEQKVRSTTVQANVDEQTEKTKVDQQEADLRETNTNIAKAWAETQAQTYENDITRAALPELTAAKKLEVEKLKAEIVELTERANKYIADAAASGGQTNQQYLTAARNAQNDLSNHVSSLAETNLPLMETFLQDDGKLLNAAMALAVAQVKKNPTQPAELGTILNKVIEINRAAQGGNKDAQQNLQLLLEGKALDAPAGQAIPEVS